MNRKRRHGPQRIETEIDISNNSDINRKSEQGAQITSTAMKIEIKSVIAAKAMADL